MLRPLLFSPLRQLGAQQRLFDVLRGHGQDLVWQYCVGAAATYEANIAEVLAAVGFQRFDLGFVVRGDQSVPVQPQLPAVGHDIGRFNVHDAGAFPVAAPPGCRMEAPEVLRPPVVEMFRDSAGDLLREPGTGDADRSAGPYESG